MFFHALLLHPQHKMQLSFPWVAATLGVKKIKPDDIYKFNVFKTCDHLLAFIQSTSRDPKKRFSLRLSAILIHGTCLIYRAQVNQMEDEILRYSCRRLAQSKAHISDTPPTPKARTKKKRAKHDDEVETPQSLIERIAPTEVQINLREFDLDQPLVLPEILESEAAGQARIEEITLREEHVPSQEQFHLADDFGAAMELPSIPSTSLPQIIPAQESISVVVDIHAPPCDMTVEEVFLEKEKQSVVVPKINVIEPAQEIQDIQPIEKGPVIQVAPEPLIEGVSVFPTEALKSKDKSKKKKEKDKEVVSEKEKETALEELQMEEEFVRPTTIPPKKSGKHPTDVLLVKRGKKKFVNINRKMEIFQEEPQFTLLTNIIPPFIPLKKFWSDWESLEVEEQVREGISVTSRISRVTEGSLGLPGDKTAETAETPASASMPLVQPIETPSDLMGPTYVSTPLGPPKKRKQPDDETVIEILPPGPRKRKKVVSIEDVRALEEPSKEAVSEMVLHHPELSEIEPITAGKTQAETGEIPPISEQIPPPIVVEEVPVSGEIIRRDEICEVFKPSDENANQEFGVKWSKNIMRVIYTLPKGWDKIRPVDICKKIKQRVIRVNMAISFASLLALSKEQFVFLHSAENSLELEFVSKGAKEFVF